MPLVISCLEAQLLGSDAEHRASTPASSNGMGTPRSSKRASSGTSVYVPSPPSENFFIKDSLSKFFIDNSGIYELDGDSYELDGDSYE